MTTTTHTVAPEDVMAWLDGELSQAEMRAIEAHVNECAECAELAEQFRETARAMAKWAVEEAPVSASQRVLKAITDQTNKGRSPERRIHVLRGAWNWRPWAVGAAVAIVLVLVIEERIEMRSRRLMTFISPDAVGDQLDSIGISPPQAETRAGGGGGGGAYADLRAAEPADGYFKGKTEVINGPLKAKLRSQAVAPNPAPMIARTVSLAIQVKDSAAARAALDGLLARHSGYSANLTVNTPESGQRDVRASLRIPATELIAALGEMRAMGRVLIETQSGEEVTQQHADLVARLENSREEEIRLRAILQQRTGKIEDVLQVEEEIARVRGEIEQMEAEQKALEHRVEFATVDLQLVEEYRERLGAPGAAQSPSARIYNSFITGIRNAGGMLLGILLFVEEFGPALLVLTALLGLPAFLLWRRYRRARAAL